MMVANKKDYYGSEYVLGNWREGLKTAELRVQVKDILTRYRIGTLQQPYETTAVALAKLLDKADTSLTALAQEMKTVVEAHNAVVGENETLKALLKAAEDKVTALEKEHATVQPKVANAVDTKVSGNSARANAGGKAKT